MKSLLAFPLALLAAALCSAQPLPGGSTAPSGGKLAPYLPTPEPVVEQMLRLAELKPGERLMDIGSGDGRIVIMGAAKFQAVSAGVEIDAQLVRQSRARIHELGLEKLATIIEGDALAQDYSSYDVIAVYLLPSSNLRLRPILEKQLRPGTRIVAHDFLIRGWKPEREVLVEDDGTGRSHTLYLYKTPQNPR
jgi:protein-L-isoaspartate O-methyltransferase